MTDAEKREKVIQGLKLCAYDPDPGQELKEIRSCPECPYYRAGCSPQLIRDALALIKSLQEDIEVWKKRYKWIGIERKTSDDPNKEPNIVKVFTIEEMERMEVKRDG